MFAFALLLSVIWGICVACFIDFATLSYFISERMTWYILSLGLSGDLLIMLLLVNGEVPVAWWQIVAIIFLSSLALLARSIIDFWAYYWLMLDIVRYAERDGTTEIDLD